MSRASATASWYPDAFSYQSYGRWTGTDSSPSGRPAAADDAGGEGGGGEGGGGGAAGVAGGAGVTAGDSGAGGTTLDRDGMAADAAAPSDDGDGNGGVAREAEAGLEGALPGHAHTAAARAAITSNQPASAPMDPSRRGETGGGATAGRGRGAMPGAASFANTTPQPTHSAAIGCRRPQRGHCISP